MHRYSVVDVFTDEAFAGNPAAVVILQDAAEDTWMQQVAAEFNLSETAYPVARPDGTWDLRWFTPTSEVDFCGHATVASAHVLWERTLHPSSEPVVFHTASGELGVSQDGDQSVLDGPSTPATEIETPDGLSRIIGTEPTFVGTTNLDDPLVGNLFVVLAEEDAVTTLDPDLAATHLSLPHGGLIVTAEADGHAYDCVSRYFTPRYGVEEDPVTGSAHCTIGTYWTAELGRTGIRARQASARGGDLNITVEGDRAKVAGTAITVMTGELLV